jgi:ADP-heptose:LPS heptosyltransferase
LPVIATPGITFFSFQKGERCGELANLPPGVSVQDLSVYFHDFGDLALLLNRMDLVITVDTSVAHLAGALGKPVWTLLTHVPDWRWLLEGETTPWYPTMRLFRQSRPNNWSDVMRRVATKLGEWQQG